MPVENQYFLSISSRIQLFCLVIVLDASKARVSGGVIQSVFFLHKPHRSLTWPLTEFTLLLYQQESYFLLLANLKALDTSLLVVLPSCFSRAMTDSVQVYFHDKFVYSNNSQGYTAAVLLDL
jgi:hypothetical protein